MPSCDVATGITIAFATSTFSADIIDFSPIFEKTVEDVDCTHQGSSTREYIPSDLVDSGECTMTILWEVGSVVPVGADPETITITFPFITASTTKGTVAGEGYIKSYSATAQLENRMEGEITIKWSGALTITDEA